MMIHSCSHSTLFIMLAIRRYQLFPTCIVTLLFGIIFGVLCHAQEAFPPPETPAEHKVAEVQEKIDLDGFLHEEAWKTAAVINNFTQQNPFQGYAPSFATEVRLLYNREFLYIAFVCFDSVQRDGLRVQNMQRDFTVRQNDVVMINIDGFLDKRNAWSFAVTPFGAQRDAHIVDEGNENLDWDALWYSRTSTNGHSWTAEFAIPWKTLRYPEGCTRLGVTFTRVIRKYNEFVTFPAIPRAYSPARMAYEAVLTGLQPPPPSLSLFLNPYFAMNTFSEQMNKENKDGFSVNIGGEAKWNVSPSSTLDVTINTDFAQADVDRQVVNLSRFSVFFPERRQFFLENASLFYTGFDRIQPFFSRGIGLNDNGQPIPIDAGVRFVSQTQERSIGAILMRQQGEGEVSASYFGVGRFTQNIGTQSYIGGLLTHRRDETTQNTRTNTTYTFDALFRPSQIWGTQLMMSLSQDTFEHDGIAVGFWTGLTDIWGYAGVVAQYVSPDYTTRSGFMGLRDYINLNPGFDLDLRPAWLPSFIRSYGPDGDLDIFWRADGTILQGDAQIALIDLEFQSGGDFEYRPQVVWQNILSASDFQPAGITLRPDFYRYYRHRLKLSTDYSSAVGGTVRFNTGSYFNGSLDTWILELRTSPIPHIEAWFSYEYNFLQGIGAIPTNKTTHLLGTNLRLAISPRLQIVGFYQYNSLSEYGGLNLRLMWEYLPRSFVYFVLNDNRLLNNSLEPRTFRQGILKLTFMQQL